MNALFAVLYVVLTFALCWIGKYTYGFIHPRTRMDRELIVRENPAFAVALGAYYLGILLAMGGPLSGGAKTGPWQDAAAFVGFGLLAVLLLNAALAADRFLEFRSLDLAGEVLDKENLAAGVVVAGAALSSALVVMGAFTGEGGALPAAVFWLYGEVLLTAATAALPIVMGFDLAREIRRKNLAVALTFAGTVIAMGNIIRLGIMGTFYGWGPGLWAATAYAVGGFVLLLLVRRLTDWILLPGVSLRRELLEEATPNTGVGFITGLFSVGASFLVGWVL